MWSPGNMFSLWFLKSVKLAVNISDPVHITTSVPIIAYFLVHKTFSSSYPCPTATWNKQCISCKQYAFLRSTSKTWDVLLFSTSTWISHSSNCPHCAGYLSINPLVVLCDKSTQNISYCFIFSIPDFIEFRIQFTGNKMQAISQHYIIMSVLFY